MSLNIFLYEWRKPYFLYKNIKNVKSTDIMPYNMGSEIIKIDPLVNGNLNVLQRGFNNIVNMHVSFDIATGLSADRLFNNVLNDSYKQYRCIVVKNISTDKREVFFSLLKEFVENYSKQILYVSHQEELINVADNVVIEGTL